MTANREITTAVFNTDPLLLITVGRPLKVTIPFIEESFMELLQEEKIYEHLPSNKKVFTPLPVYASKDTLKYPTLLAWEAIRTLPLFHYHSMFCNVFHNVFLNYSVNIYYSRPDGYYLFTTMTRKQRNNICTDHTPCL